MLPDVQYVELLPWWVERIVVPVAFTLFGAFLGFVLTWFKDFLDERSKKKAFLQATRLELISLKEQLEASLSQAEESAERFKATRQAPGLLGTLRNTVFTTQLGKLKSLNDPLLIELVKFYSDVSVLESLLKKLARTGESLSTALASEARGRLEDELSSALRVLQEQLRAFIWRCDLLIERLPKV